jgi:hypothetical protein
MAGIPRAKFAHFCSFAAPAALRYPCTVSRAGVSLGEQKVRWRLSHCIHRRLSAGAYQSVEEQRDGAKQQTKGEWKDTEHLHPHRQYIAYMHDGGCDGIGVVALNHAVSSLAHSMNNTCSVCIVARYNYSKFGA